MLDLFYKGGPLMYPLLLGSVLMVAIIIERACHFIGTGENRRVFDQVRGYIQNKEFEKAEKITHREKSPVFILIKEALNMRDSSKEEIENLLSIR